MKLKLWSRTVLVCMLVPSSLVFGQQVRLPEGTPVRLRLKADLASDQVVEGGRVDFEVARPVIIQGMTVIPVGAVSWGAVQSVKKGKFIKFDIEGVRLPDLTNIKLRSVGTKPKNPGQDQIKADSSFNGRVGAAKGTEYTAYVDEEKKVAASGSIGNPAIAATPTPSAQAGTPPPPPAQEAISNPPGATPLATSNAPTAGASVGTPTTPATPPAAISPVQAATPIANVERIKVECYSVPSAADILIDGEFYGNTPSILMLPVGKHDLEIQLSGYKTWGLPLILQPGTEIRTIRATLEQTD